MINWLEKNNVPFDKKSKKPELYEIIKSKKQLPVYKVDEFLKRKGHEILRLPPYHCEFNPIEPNMGRFERLHWKGKFHI